MAAPRAEIPLVILSESSPTSPIAGATVYVKNRLTEELASVYSNAGTTEEKITQPLSSDSLGRVTGWLPRGSYKFEITIPGKSAYAEYVEITPGQDGSVDTAFIAKEAVTLEKIASSAKDAAAGTSSLRSLGTGSTQACAGNDSRLTNERVPTAGSVTTAKVADGAITNAKMAAGSGFIPTGGILPFAGTTAPTGFLLCNGTSKLKTEYEALWGIIEYKYGGSGANFNLPNLSGRFPLGVGAPPNGSEGSTNRSLAAGGGEQNHTLSTGELASHTHFINLNTSVVGNHVHLSSGGGQFLKNGGNNEGGGAHVQATGGSYNLWTSTEWAGEHAHNLQGSSFGEGGNQAHNNLPPFLVLSYIIKT